MDFNFNRQISDSRKQLMQSALKFTRDAEEADDLVQDTLMKAIRHETKFEEGTNLQAWLFTILKNTFLNNCKAIKRRTAVLIRNVEPWSATIQPQNIHNQGDGRMISDDVNQALANLQPEYAVPFLKYFEGYHYDEIAKELDIPLGTVKNRIHIARKILKSKLKMYA